MTPNPVDWSAAVKVGVAAAPTGPRISALDAARAVADLRAFSRSAELAVRDVTGLGGGMPVLDGTVVDRPGWIASTVEGMSVLTEPLTRRIGEQLLAKADEPSARKGRSAKTHRHRPPAEPSAVAAAPIGAVLGYLSGKVLGQFDPFVGDSGRLLLVAPNIVQVERAIGADPRDFRTWVCLHESTHRLQFLAVPWLRSHFQNLVADFADEAELDAGALLGRLRGAVLSRRTDATSWIEATQTPAQRAVFDRLIAMMTLLEGHADYVMDAVGPQVVPSVAQIRARFTERRRRGGGPLDRLVRSLLGMDLKIQQYIRGGAFVHAVVDTVGMANFNTIWSAPEALPTRDEIAAPDAWIARVLA